MSGLSAAGAARLAELEAKPELASVERGELRALAQSRPTGEQRARVDRLLTASDSGDAYARGLARGTASGGRAYGKD